MKTYRINVWVSDGIYPQHEKEILINLNQDELNCVEKIISALFNNTNFYRYSITEVTIL